MKSIEEISALFRQWHLPSYRLKQILNAVIKNGQISYDEISQLPAATRDFLSKNLPLLSLSRVSSRHSSDGRTIKVLFRLSDGQLVESVLMRFADGRNSICLSCQSGCSMGCLFCATGTIRNFRNLTTEEIFDQVIYLNFLLKNEPDSAGESISNIVFMGMGEPLRNYDNLLASIKMICDKNSFAFSPRRITISTCGIPDGIRRLADEQIPFNLAVSLHAPNQQLRESLMPVARAYPLKDLLESVKYFFERTGRRVSFEYILLKDLNDRQEHAQQLSAISRNKMLHVNLIPYNNTSHNKLQGSDRKAVTAFKNALQKNGVNVTVRTSLGGEIGAACGQLANQ